MTEQNGGLFVWLQDNARIILSIALVLFLLFAVYNYSQDRTESVSHAENSIENDENKSSEKSENISEIAEETEKLSETEKDATEEKENSEETEVAITSAETAESTEKVTSNESSENTSSEVTKILLSESNDTIGAKTEEPEVKEIKTEEPEITEKEIKITGKGPTVVYNDNDITASAMRGDGLTHIARRATSEYLNQNNISDLDASQKIYVEDYVRRSVAKIQINPGTIITFKHDVFAAGIEKAKSLTESQKHNLSKYTKGLNL